MNTRHLVDPELLPALGQWPAAARTREALAARRAALPAMLPQPESYARPDVSHERVVVPGPPGGPDVPLYLYRPLGSDGALPVYLHIHGGGYVYGCAEMNGPANVQLSGEVKCLVASIDYRLAPETRAPGSVEDCYAALAWLHREAHELGIDRGRIAIGGESAGGGLAAALALLARDRGEPPVCFQLLASPMLDDRTVARADVSPNVGEFVWTQAENRFGWDCLLGHEPGREGVSPYCAAARADDLSNLPPAFIGVGALDLFCEEDVRYALRLIHHGVPTELHVWAGAYHGFERTASAQVVLTAERTRKAALKRAFARV